MLALAIFCFSLNLILASETKSCSSGSGILDDHEKFCCPLSCGSCGGIGCSSRPGGASNCCISIISNSNIQCGSPPCIHGDHLHAGRADSPPKRKLSLTCEERGGVLHEDGLRCCPETCYDCEGTECDEESVSECCGSIRFLQSWSCFENDPPCIIEETDICTYLGGVISVGETVCCASYCETCDSDNCDLELSECCTEDIFSSGVYCDDAVLPCMAVPSDINIKRNISLGVFSGDVYPSQKEETIGLGTIFNDRLIFQAVTSLNYDEIEEVVLDGRRPILNMEFFGNTSEPVLAKIVAGDFDSYLVDFAVTCAEKGNEFWIRTLHEFNGDWYQWGLLYWYNGEQSNTVEDYSAAFQRVISIFEAANAPVYFQLDINNVNGLEDQTPFAEFWPNITGLSAVTITTYNRAYSTPTHQYTLSFYDAFKDSYDQIVELSDLPIWVAETATTSYGTDKPAWLTDVFVSIAINFPKVEQLTWFLYNKTEEGVLLDWDLNTDEEIAGFVEGYTKMQELLS